jgi:hypothetical protein
LARAGARPTAVRQFNPEEWRLSAQIHESRMEQEHLDQAYRHIAELKVRSFASV